MKSTSVISLNAVANPVVMAIPYLYCLIAAIYFERASLPLVIVGGAFLGLGSAGFYMLWQRLFASFDSDRGNLDLIRGTAYGAIMYFGLYRVAFPFVIASFLLLPFSSLEYARWQAAILYAVYSVVIMLMMIQCAQASRDRGINPVFIYGFFGGIVYTLHDVGFLAGTFSEQVRIWGIDPLATTALVSLYLLGFMFFIGQGGFKRVLRHDPSAENIELIMLDGRPPSVRQEASSASCPQTPRARIALRAHLREIPSPHLKITSPENTIRTHSKCIYAKLDVHKKQELIDMLKAVEL